MTTTDDKSKAATDLFEQAMKNYEQALKSGLKLQEESARMWTAFAGQAGNPQDVQKRVKAWSDDVIPQTQKALDEYLKLIEQNSKASVDLLKKALVACQASTLQETQNRFLGVWEGSLNALRDTAVSVAQTNARVTEAWTTSARKAWETPATATSASKA